MRTLLLPIALLATGCVPDDELGTLTKSEAAIAFTTMKARLQEVHSLVLSGERPPNQFEYGCASGTIDLRISLDAELQPQTLTHTFDACAVEDLIFDGAIYYRNIDTCERTDGFAMSIYGRIDLIGAMEGFCTIQARDACGTYSGMVCGFPAAELGT